MAALRAAVFPLSAKNRRGGHFLPPPPPVRVLTLASGGGGGVDATPMSFSELDAKPFGVSC